MNDELYSRQILFPPIGEAGQERIGRGSVFVAGCGAVGTAIASHLARAGVGRLVIADFDRVALSNLPRQTLFDRRDALDDRPKVEAAKKRLIRINPDVTVEAREIRIGPENVEGLARGADVIADACDSVPLRFCLNDAALKLAIPWVYTGVIAGVGHGMTIPAGGCPCLRCYLSEPPPVGAVATCSMAGVIGPAVACIAALSAAEILRFLTGHPPVNVGRLTVVDIWNNRHRHVLVEPDPDCPACGAGRFEFLEGEKK